MRSGSSLRVRTFSQCSWKSREELTGLHYNKTRRVIAHHTVFASAGLQLNDRHASHANPMNTRTHALAEVIWNYHQLNHQLERADAILVLCSHDLRVAERGAELFLDGWAPLLIFSGGLGAITRELWDQPEADQFADIAFQLGVPREKILLENKS